MSSSGDYTITPLQKWLVLIVASVGFLFDTYELLMLPVIAGPALSEIMQLPPGHPEVTAWFGRLLWMAALAGGIFGLLGGWLIDMFGRKTIMVLSILMYSVSPVLAAMSTELWQFVLFRCTTFVGVCVEFVAAITWLSELFPNKKTRVLVIGWTQAFASVGGLLVTGANQLAVDYANVLPAIPVREPFDQHASWRYTLITGLVPGIIILILLPFVPESRVWRERKRAGQLRRPRFSQLFSPELRRATLVMTGLSACAYAAAFGALQMIPTRVVPGLESLKPVQKELAPLRKAGEVLDNQLSEERKTVEKFVASNPDLKAHLDQRSVVRRELRTINLAISGLKTKLEAGDNTVQEKLNENQTKLKEVQAKMPALNEQLTNLSVKQPEIKGAVLAYEKTLAEIGKNRAARKVHEDKIKTEGNYYQFWQEMGGLTGRIMLAILIVFVLHKKVLLWIFQVPGLILFPLTFYFFFKEKPDFFVYGVFICGLVTVAQFSFFGEHMPKIFPMHLRGTGGSFATNVGGRMIGTSAAFVNTELITKSIAPANTPPFAYIAISAAIIGGTVFLVGMILTAILPKLPEGE